MTAGGVGGLIIAGGQGVRLGTEKPLATLNGRSLLDIVLARAEAQVGLLGLNVRPQMQDVYASRYPRVPLVLDTPGLGEGPLAGLAAGLEWLSGRDGFGWLATFPCDTPFLPKDLVATLLAASAGISPARPAVAVAKGRIHSLCAIWPIAAHARVKSAIETKAWFSVRQALSGLGAVEVCFDDDAEAFFNINTADDLSEAERLAPAYLQREI